MIKKKVKLLAGREFIVAVDRLYPNKWFNNNLILVEENNRWVVAFMYGVPDKWMEEKVNEFQIRHDTL